VEWKEDEVGSRGIPLIIAILDERFNGPDPGSGIWDMGYGIWVDNLDLEYVESNNCSASAAVINKQKMQRHQQEVA